MMRCVLLCNGKTGKENSGSNNSLAGNTQHGKLGASTMTLLTIHFVKRPLATHFLAKSPTNAKPQQERSRSCQILSDKISAY